jgi:hypothetical protein
MLSQDRKEKPTALRGLLGLALTGIDPRDEFGIVRRGLRFALARVGPGRPITRTEDTQSQHSGRD